MLKPRVRIRDGRVVLRDVNLPVANPELVAHLEDALEKAKSGELISMFWVSGWHGDHISRGWVYDTRSSRRIMLSHLTQAWMEWVVWNSVRDGDSALVDMFSSGW